MLRIVRDGMVRSADSPSIERAAATDPLELRRTNDPPSAELSIGWPMRIAASLMLPAEEEEHHRDSHAQCLGG